MSRGFCLRPPPGVILIGLGALILLVRAAVFCGNQLQHCGIEDGCRADGPRGERGGGGSGGGNGNSNGSETVGASNTTGHSIHRLEWSCDCMILWSRGDGHDSGCGGSGDGARS